MLNKPRPGKIFVISAPSGAGKTSLCLRLVREIRNISISVSMTTRRPRAGEVKDKDYFFVTQARFKKLLKEEKFLEWANVHGNFYGTPKDFVKKETARGNDVLLIIDVQGAMQVKKMAKEAALIFIKPPSIKTLKERLKKRMTEQSPQIKKRLSIAKEELKYLNKYDYKVLNDNFEEALKKLKSIILKERQR